ncbi:hypothetical protein AEGHOMDF_1139 [Methylobacterium soli]|nr:hypothetical protein AEGHOMDF_1139 [Methylobacterium soli]
MRISLRPTLRLLAVVTAGVIAFAAFSLVGRAYHPTEAVADQVQPSDEAQPEAAPRSNDSD